MTSLRAFQPVIRHGVRSLVRPASRRFLNADTAPVLYSASSTAKGGRGEGHVASHRLNTDIDVPEKLGGPGKHTNPEELFAAAYGTCFQNAMNVTAKSMGIHLPQNLDDNILETTVHLVGSMKELDLGIKVDMKVKVQGVSQEDLQKVIDKSRTICPYSRALKDNVPTNIEVVAM